MKALIIGGAGFVGGHLARHLQEVCRWTVGVTKLPHERTDIPGADVHHLDILDPDAVAALLRAIRPDCIFHLAAQSSVALSWKNPALTVDVNVKGALNVLDGVRALDYKPRVLLIGSGEEYGRQNPDEVPISEGNPLRPGNIYAATKACQNMLGKIYADAYNLDIMSVRAFNHIGPGQVPMFVVADFCKQVSEIEQGLREPVIKVGNLSAKRDFTDVRDVVRAYSLLIDRGEAGETYNVGSGHAVAIQELLNRILALSTSGIAVEPDPGKFRPVDVPLIEADIAKLQKTTGWKPEIPLDKTLAETLAFWRETS